MGEIMGLLDNFNIDDPRTMGLLNAGFSMMGNSGASRTPVNLGQILSGGLQAYAGTQDEFRKRKQQEAELAQMAQHRGLQMQQSQMQVDQLRQQIKDQESMRKAMIDYANLKRGAPSKVQSQGISAGELSSGVTMPSIAKQPSSPQAKQNAIQSRIDDLNAQADYFESQGISGDALRAKTVELTKLLPKYANDYRIGKDAQGNLVNVRLADDGSEIYSSTPVAEEYHFGDTGQQLIKTGKYSGKTSNVAKKMQTPDSIASNATTQRGQNKVDERARDFNEITRLGQQTQLINDPNQGILLVDKATGFTRKPFDQTGSQIPSESQSKKTASANNILPILDSAEELIGGATGSYIGAGVDKIPQVFGGSTGGAQNIAQLKVLEGALMMNQPRMEGPQSDKDTALYRQMAGQIGDPTIPSNIKKSALAQIRAMHQKYATNGNTGQGAKSTGGWSIQKVD